MKVQKTKFVKHQFTCTYIYTQLKFCKVGCYYFLGRRRLFGGSERCRARGDERGSSDDLRKSEEEEEGCSVVRWFVEVVEESGSGGRESKR